MEATHLGMLFDLTVNWMSCIRNGFLAVAMLPNSTPILPSCRSATIDPVFLSTLVPGRTRYFSLVFPLVGDVEEFQRVDRDGDFKLTVDGGDGADMALGHADLDIFDGVALFIDNLSADRNFFLRREQDGQEDGCQR